MRCAQLYIRDDNTPAIVAAMHRNVAGIYYEQDDPAVIPRWRSGDTLARALRYALERYCIKDRNLRHAKRTDWPSYRASPCRSVRDFECSYVRIFIEPLNEAEVIFSAEAKPLDEEDIALRVIFQRSAEVEEISRLLFRLFDACRKWSAELA